MFVKTFPLLVKGMTAGWKKPPLDFEAVECMGCSNRHWIPMTRVVIPWIHPHNRKHMQRVYVCTECVEYMIWFTDFAAIPPCKFWEFVQWIRFDEVEDWFIRFPVLFRPRLKYVGRPGCDYQHLEYWAIWNNKHITDGTEYTITELIKIILKISGPIDSYIHYYDFDTYDGNLICEDFIPDVAMYALQDIGYTLAMERRCATSRMRMLPLDIVREICKHLLMELFDDKNAALRIWRDYHTSALQ